MALTIRTTVSPTAGYSLATPEQLKEKALDRTDVAPGNFEVVGITLPRTQNDTSGLQTVSNGGFFHTTGGVLHLNLVQEIFISNALSPCAQTVVLQHERGHVRDNENLMPRLDVRQLAHRKLHALSRVHALDYGKGEGSRYGVGIPPYERADDRSVHWIERQISGAGLGGPRRGGGADGVER